MAVAGAAQLCVTGPSVTGNSWTALIDTYDPGNGANLSTSASAWGLPGATVEELAAAWIDASNNLPRTPLPGASGNFCFSAFPGIVPRCFTPLLVDCTTDNIVPVSAPTRAVPTVTVISPLPNCSIPPSDTSTFDALLVGDSDVDSVTENGDSCPDVGNPGQQDVNANNVGDVCDNCPFFREFVFGRGYCLVDPAVSCVKDTDCSSGVCAKAAFYWQIPLDHRYAVGPFETPDDIIGYPTSVIADDTGSSVLDPVDPPKNWANWYLMATELPQCDVADRTGGGASARRVTAAKRTRLRAVHTKSPARRLAAANECGRRDQRPGLVPCERRIDPPGCEQQRSGADGRWQAQGDGAAVFLAEWK